MTKRLRPIWYTCSLRFPFGNIGPVLMWTDRRGRKVIMARRGPKPPPSASQLRVWWEVALVAAEWNRLTEEERQAWREVARRTYSRCSGYALFHAACRDPNPTWAEALQQKYPDLPLIFSNCTIPLDWNL